MCKARSVNWANVLRFAEHTSDSSTNYDLFLNELLVRRIWFGQFDELYFVLSWLVMRCKLRPELRRAAADSMIIEKVG